MNRRDAALAALLLAGAGAGWTQPAPSTQQLIEQLQAPAPARSLGPRRGFKVQAAESPASAAAADDTTARNNDTAAPVPPRPSVSLSIEFDFDSARVRSDSLPVLGNLAQALQSPALQNTRFLVEGHTDASGRADHNLRLSTQRAQAVQAWLVAQGVAASRLTATGKGASEPVQPLAPTAAANRRVRIVNLD